MFFGGSAFSGGSVFAGSNQIPTFLSGEGRPQFDLGQLQNCGGPVIHLGHNSGVFWRALDASTDGLQLFGVSGDEFHEIDFASGASQHLGGIGFSAGKRFWFTECEDSVAVFQYSDGPVAGPLMWYLSVTVTLAEYPIGWGEVFSETLIEASGTISEQGQYGDVVTEIIEEPDIVSAELELSIQADGDAELALTHESGYGIADVHGVLVVITPNDVDAEPIPISASGLSVAPDGRIYLLSESRRDPFGESALYELDTTGGEVIAAYVSTPDVSDIHAIEFAADGRLFGAGESLYEIDLGTGNSTLLASIDGAKVVELDHAPDGHLYAMKRHSDGDTTLDDVTPSEPVQSTLAYLDSSNHWGLASLGFEPADFDMDGDVDADDVDFFNADFTGSGGGPIVPAGLPEPPLSPIAVPLSSSPDDRTRIAIDATSDGLHGTIVEGLPTDKHDTSAVVSLGHFDSWIHVSVQVSDDHRSDTIGEDIIELYFDTNNSDSPIREGDANGFKASFDSRGTRDGDVAPFVTWDAESSSPYRPGPRVEFMVKKTPGYMATGGTYGFDMAFKDTDITLADSVKYFLFSQDLNGEQDEGQWGDIYLAPGPLPGQATNPFPPNHTIGSVANLQLGWTNPAEVIESRVYVGLQPDALRYQGTETTESFAGGPVSPATRYYWRVDSVNSNGVRRGKVWEFSTGLSPADVDRDGDIDDHDRRRLFQRPLGDVTGNGLIGPEDFAAIVAAMGSSVGDPQYDEAVDYDSDGTITPSDVGRWQCYSIQGGNAASLDLDGDGDVDNGDIAFFVNCLQGPAVSIEPGCQSPDLNVDTKVDLRDAAILQQLFGDVLR
ncbi:MAG: hypothetical protein DHS20C16_05300 [Phycisphaerae bacterium]|nr:MAG: hypothetical protein DHS20C16_05300 [Phycisphaerae bacterium]